MRDDFSAVFGACGAAAYGEPVERAPGVDGGVAAAVLFRPIAARARRGEFERRFGDRVVPILKPVVRRPLGAAAPALDDGVGFRRGKSVRFGGVGGVGFAGEAAGDGAEMEGGSCEIGVGVRRRSSVSGVRTSFEAAEVVEEDDRLKRRPYSVAKMGNILLRPEALVPAPECVEKADKALKKAGKGAKHSKDTKPEKERVGMLQRVLGRVKTHRSRRKSLKYQGSRAMVSDPVIFEDPLDDHLGPTGLYGIVVDDDSSWPECNSPLQSCRSDAEFADEYSKRSSSFSILRRPYLASAFSERKSSSLRCGLRYGRSSGKGARTGSLSSSRHSLGAFTEDASWGDGRLGAELRGTMSFNQDGRVQNVIEKGKMSRVNRSLRRGSIEAILRPRHTARHDVEDHSAPAGSPYMEDAPARTRRGGKSHLSRPRVSIEAMMKPKFMAREHAYNAAAHEDAARRCRSVPMRSADPWQTSPSCSQASQGRSRLLSSLSAAFSCSSDRSTDDGNSWQGAMSSREYGEDCRSVPVYEPEGFSPTSVLDLPNNSNVTAESFSS